MPPQEVEEFEVEEMTEMMSKGEWEQRQKGSAYDKSTRRSLEEDPNTIYFESDDEDYDEE